MNIKDFHKPEQHPYGMLEGYKNAHEKENRLAFWLRWAMGEGSLLAVRHFDKNEYYDLLEDGLLETVGGEGWNYRLSKKAIGFLFSVYGKEIK